MISTQHSLIALLADGCFHSGEALGNALGISRSAVWKSLQKLDELGLELHAVAGRGYRLAAPIELLANEHITQLLTQRSRSQLSKLVIFHSIDSTNKQLKSDAEQGIASGTVYLAEHQSDGRGRRGRYWHSPYGTNLYLSLLWRFNDGMSRLGTLSHSVAVALVRSFNQLGASGIGIKWPNDVITAEGKLAGVLIDVAGESGGPCHAVIGIGVNYCMSHSMGNAIDQPWTQLVDCGVTAGRNEVTASILSNLVEVISTYEQLGFEPFRAEWVQYDALRDSEVSVMMGDTTYSGIARGIDETGLLLLERDGELYRYAAGDVSLRKVPS